MASPVPKTFRIAAALPGSGDDGLMKSRTARPVGGGGMQGPQKHPPYAKTRKW